jgi:hypothetical protein
LVLAQKTRVSEIGDLTETLWSLIFHDISYVTVLVGLIPELLIKLGLAATAQVMIHPATIELIEPSKDRGKLGLITPPKNVGTQGSAKVSP